jgi:hypothetical protein
VIESYHSLREDYTETSTALLRQISLQLANPSTHPIDIDLPGAFKAAPSDVQVNVLWFISLIISLFVALFGIFLKQWIRTYMKWTEITPERDALAMRHYRRTCIEVWHLESLLNQLPILLEIALILFLCGLLIFLWNVDAVVAQCATALVAFSLMSVAVVTLLPAVISTCPFKSPSSQIFLILKANTVNSIRRAQFQISLVARWLGSVVQARILCDHESRESVVTRLVAGPPPLLFTWKDLDQSVMKRFEEVHKINFQVDALRHVLGTTHSEDLTAQVLTCLAEECTPRFHSVTFDVWLSTVRQIIDPRCPNNNHLRDRYSPAPGVQDLSEQTMNSLLRFCESFFLLPDDLGNSEASANCFPLEETTTVVSFLTGLAVNQTSMGSLVGILTSVLARDLAGMPETQVGRIVVDLIMAFRSKPATSIVYPDGAVSHISVVKAVKRYWMYNIASVGRCPPRHQELVLMDVLLQLAMAGIADTGNFSERHLIRELLSILPLQSTLSGSYSSYDRPGAATILRPSAWALVRLARSRPEIFPPRLAHGVWKLVKEPFNYCGPIPPNDWTRILNKFKSRIDTEELWVSTRMTRWM